MSTTTASATSVIARVLRRRRPARPAVPPRPTSLRAVLRLHPEPCMAGARPKRMPVASEITRAKPKSRRSIAACARRGTLAGPAWARTRIDQHGQQQAQGAASQSQQDAFGEKLRDDASAAGTQGGTERDLFAAGGAARQQEVGDIHARHQQEASHGGHQHPKRAADAAEELVIQGEGRRAPAFIQGGQGLLHLRTDGIELGATPGSRGPRRRAITVRKRL